MSFKLATSSYSFHRFGEGPEGDAKPGLREMVDRAADLGLDGLEILGVHFDGTSPEELAALRGHAARRGVALVAVSAHHNFVNPDPAKRREAIDVVAKWVDVADDLGALAVRVFGGRWATRPVFAEYMAANGEEPPLAGYSDDDGFAWNAEALRIASYYAGRKGIHLALENHWGFTGTAAGVLRILRDVDSPWLRVALDTGNFNYRPDQYAELAELAPHAILVHAKTYVGGGLYYTADLDYRRIGRLLAEVGFRGYVSIEFEGRAHPDVGLRESVSMLRESFAGL
jgi:sugar phosphate isomerase/epimerase